MINIYTDGACSGNPGIGGWGVVILDNNKEILLNGGDQHTTNNKMELTAAIKALEYFEIKKELIIYTDSKYVKDDFYDQLKLLADFFYQNFQLLYGFC